MISFLPLNQLITIMSFAASVIVHCILTIIIYYHFDNKKNLIIKNYNTVEVEILVAPKKKKSNYMNKTEENTTIPPIHVQKSGFSENAK